MHNITKINHHKNEVKARLLKKFPGCRYTIIILLWDDGTFRVRCQSGDIISTAEIKLRIYQWYEGRITYLEETHPNLIGNA